MAIKRSNGALGLSFTACRALQFACLIAVLGMTARFVSEMVDDVQQPPEPLVGVLSITCLATLYTIITYILYHDSQLPLLPTAALDTSFFLALLIASIIVGKPLSYLSCKAVGAATAANYGSSSDVKSFTENLGAEINKNPTLAEPVVGSSSTTSTWAAYVAAATTTAAAYDTIYTSSSSAVVAVATPTASSSSGKTYVTGADGLVYHVHSNPGRSVSASSSGSSVDRGLYMQAVDYSRWVGGTERVCDMMKAIWGLGIALTILYAFSVMCILFIWKKERESRRAAMGKISAGVIA